MKRIAIIFFLLLAFQVQAQERVKAIASIPDIAWLIKQIGGEQVEVQSFLSSNQDPHFADASPKFVLLASQADLLCKVGLELEIGWLPKVIEQSGNQKISSGATGDCDLARNIQALEIPAEGGNLSMGDVHRYGNPHYWNSPLRLASAGEEVVKKLSELRPELKSEFEKNYDSLKHKLLALNQKNKNLLAKHFASGTGPVFVQYHKEFVYWAYDHGLKSLGAIEEKPGIPPSAGRLAQFSIEAKKTGIKMIWASKQNNHKLVEKFAELSGLPVLWFDVSISDINDPLAYEKLQNAMVQEMLKY